MDTLALLSNNQVAMRDTVRRFSRKKIGPRAAEIDRSGEFPRDVYEAMAELGLFGLTLPVEAGGSSADIVTYALVHEELAQVSGTAANLQAASESAILLNDHAPATLRERYLPGVLDGSIVPAFALTEPTAGSDARGLRARAVRDGDRYVINGAKQFTTFAAVADFIVVLAITDPTKDRGHISAILVEASTPGVQVAKAEDLVGVRGTATASVYFDNCAVPVENLIGKEGEGLRLGLNQINKGRIAVAAMAVGLAQGAHDLALAYAHERMQFGKPIFEFQAVQFKLAQMATRIDAARLLYLTAAQLEDRGTGSNRLTSEAKLYASETAAWVTEEALQVFGGYGYTRSNPVERYWRDAKITQIYEGTTNIQHIVIARILSKEHRERSVV
ncbi:acyl-CoA dehydrogenase family protein [Mesorhizobium sp.]|uniref:acyl-CoA dehydrogenase family protein n=1 Tax=Mesorhizobium sp. TaxID=1871066 RepID=UPI000FE49C40|nr:acyl-CoA dehydrogenase family protein [Mesorhizobium sp.]RWI88904.1 MAG: acyl-CoA dehydrogenase [Mesorhizobium sp.]